MSGSKLTSTQQWQRIKEASLWNRKQTARNGTQTSVRNPPSPSVVLQQLEVSDDRRQIKLTCITPSVFCPLPFEWKRRRKESQPKLLISRKFISKQSVTCKHRRTGERKVGGVCLSARNCFHTLYIVASLTRTDDYF